MDYKEIEMRLSREKAKKDNKSAADDAVQFYYQNKNVCDKAYEYYKSINVGTYQKKLVTLTGEDIGSRVSDGVIVVITATELEHTILIRTFSELYNKKWELYHINDLSFYAFKAKGKNIVHIKAGNSGDEYTRRAINLASKKFHKIDTLILLGICYGIYHRSQSIGNVVVSEKVCGYRINFCDDETDMVIFDPEEEFNKEPSERFFGKIKSLVDICQPINTFFQDWDKDTELANIKWGIGKFLSSNSLMSSKIVKDCVVNRFETGKRKARGGEMEACGIFKSRLCEERDFGNWLVIKSICDWGEKKNSLFPNDKDMEEQVKDSFQAVAMMNSCFALFTLLREHSI